jgi:hypothetical protein
MRKKIMLRDAPGAREFINSVVSAAEDIAIALTGIPDDEAEARLQRTSENLKRDLTPEIGADAAGQVADIFCCAVLGEKAEGEALIAQGIL